MNDLQKYEESVSMTCLVIEELGTLLDISWAVGLYQKGDRYTLVSHHDYEGQHPADFWWVNDEDVDDILSELSEMNYSRLANTPTIDRYMKTIVPYKKMERLYW